MLKLHEHATFGPDLDGQEKQSLRRCQLDILRETLHHGNYTFSPLFREHLARKTHRQHEGRTLGGDKNETELEFKTSKAPRTGDRPRFRNGRPSERGGNYITYIIECGYLQTPVYLSKPIRSGVERRWDRENRLVRSSTLSSSSIFIPRAPRPT